jgi:hypothetical protein
MNEVQQGELLRDEGMQRALDKANHDVTWWGKRAYALLVAYAKNNATFATEDVIAWGDRTHFPMPPEPRAWGAIIRQGVKAGLLLPAGYTKSKNARAHRRPVQLWQSTTYQE